MSQIYGVDVSEAQGVINWDVLNQNTNFVIIRSCFGTARQDLQFQRNRSEARRVQAAAGPLGIGYYHFSYPQYAVNTPQAEAEFFCNNVMPLQPGEILVLDFEEPYSGDVVEWCKEFCDRVQQLTTVRPLIYLNQSQVNGLNWGSVIQSNYGLWEAVYDNNPSGPGVSTPWPVVAMRQWTDNDHVAGISNAVDGDVFYGDFQLFAKYGYQPAAPAPQPAPAPAPAPEPAPATNPTPVEEPPAPPAPNPVTPPAPVEPTPSPSPVIEPNKPQKLHWWEVVALWIGRHIFRIKL